MNWSVMWLVPQNGGPHRINEVWFDNDLREALRIYVKALNAGKPMATLRCANVGFPPPEKFQEYDLVKMRIKGETQWVKVLARMLKANRKGIWWCPYCREFRRFQTQGGAFFEGVFTEDQAGMYCPMCGISHRDFHVRKWNPRAHDQYTLEKRTRREIK
jgi:hypothetical protein